MKDYLELKNSKDKLERTVYWIHQLSPHNLWKAVDALKELQEEVSKATRERDIGQLLKTVKDRRCPPGGLNEVSRAIIEGFNRAIDYVVEDVESLNNQE